MNETTRWVIELIFSIIFGSSFLGAVLWVVRWVRKKSKKNAEDKQKLYESLAALLKVELIRQHREYSCKHYATIDEKDNFNEVYKCYIYYMPGDDAINKCQEEIMRLPLTAPPKHNTNKFREVT